MASCADGDKRISRSTPQEPPAWPRQPRRPTSQPLTTSPIAGFGGATKMIGDGNSGQDLQPHGTEAAIAEFISKHGITRCPTACVVATQGEVGASDRAALAAYATGRERSRQARSAQRARPFWLGDPQRPGSDRR